MDLKPNPWQAAILSLWDIEEIFYGGAAGPGKSTLMLLESSQFHDYPTSRSLLLRNSYPDLIRSGALLDVAKTLWRYKAGIHYNDKDKIFTFPSGATTTFGVMEHEDDHEKYSGTEWTFIGFDEATLLIPGSMTFLASRQRKIDNNPVPIRRRWASNPGGPAHSWVKNRFITPPNTRDRVFVPGFAKHNPHLDAEDYHKRMVDAGMTQVEIQRLRDGNWDAISDTGKFQTDKMGSYTGRVPGKGGKQVRYWDLASTEKNANNYDPDYTVGIKMIYRDGEFFVDDMIRGRWSEGHVEQIIKETAEKDGVECPVRIEREPGSAGKISVRLFAKYVLPGYDCQGMPSTGSKDERARPLAGAVANSLVHVREAPWTDTLKAELQSSSQGGHDDIRDGMSGGHIFLVGRSGGVVFID